MPTQAEMGEAETLSSAEESDNFVVRLEHNIQGRRQICDSRGQYENLPDKQVRVNYLVKIITVFVTIKPSRKRHAMFV